MATANDKAWAEAFACFDIPQKVQAKGFFDVTSDELRAFREPRLMCKIDFKSQTPVPLANHNLSILAIENKLYRIAPTNTFISIDSSKLPKTPSTIFKVPTWLRSFDKITNEARALDCAYACGMIADLQNTSETFPSIRGRMFSKDFSFSLEAPTRTIEYPIKSVQIEIDAGYESPSEIVLVEGKMGMSDNLSIRQLIYPQKHIETLGKSVTTYVMFFRPPGDFFFIPFRTEPISYLDAENAKYFKLVQEQPKLKMWRMSDIKIDNALTGFDAPFPQANNFERILEALWKLDETPNQNAEDLFAEFDLTSRQYGYYANALIWLGVAQDYYGNLGLTSLGREIVKLPVHEQLQRLAEIVFSNEIAHAFLSSKTPTISQEARTRAGLRSESTFIRRMSTIRSWTTFFERALTTT